MTLETSKGDPSPSGSMGSPQHLGDGVYASDGTCSVAERSASSVPAAADRIRRPIEHDAANEDVFWCGGHRNGDAAVTAR
jgi:hypothetical protein